MQTAITRTNTAEKNVFDAGMSAKALETLQAFDLADKMLAGAASRAGFKDEEDMLSYVKSVRQCRS